MHKLQSSGVCIITHFVHSEVVMAINKIWDMALVFMNYRCCNIHSVIPDIARVFFTDKCLQPMIEVCVSLTGSLSFDEWTVDEWLLLIENEGKKSNYLL